MMWYKKLDQNCHLLKVLSIGKDLIYYYEGEGEKFNYL
jgi:hypothetical protein